MGDFALFQSAEFFHRGGDQVQRVLGATVVRNTIEAGHFGVLLGRGLFHLILGVRVVGGVQGKVQIQGLAAHVEFGQLVAPHVETVVLPTDATTHFRVAQQRVLQLGVVILGIVGGLRQLGGEGFDETHAYFFARLVHAHYFEHLVLVFAFFLGFFVLDVFVLGFFFDEFEFLLRLFLYDFFDLFFDDLFLLGDFFNGFGFFFLGNFFDLFNGFFRYGLGFLLGRLLLFGRGGTVFHRYIVHFLATPFDGASSLGHFLLAFFFLLVQHGDQYDDDADDGECDAQADGEVLGQQFLFGDG